MGNWQLDPYHTQVEFSAKHLGMMTVRGYFDEVSATADIDPEHPEVASVQISMSAASIRTNNPAISASVRPLPLWAWTTSIRCALRIRARRHADATSTSHVIGTS